MAWEMRGNGRYYYRKVRRGDKVLNEYVGAGEFAEALAQLGEIKRRQQLLQREERQQVLAAHRRLDQKIAELGDQVRSLITLVMIAHGYRTHKRQWRKKRMTSMSKETTLRLNQPLKNVDDVDELNRLLTAVNTDNPTRQQRAEFLQHLEAAPELARLLGDASAALVEQILQQLHGEGSSRIAIGVHLDNIRRGLDYDHVPQLERMLIDHVVVCWLRWQQVEWSYQTRVEETQSSVEVKHWENRLNATQRRYLRAIETHARVHRLGIALQINIATNGGQQVNVAK